MQTCTACGATHDDGARFCSACGAGLTVARAARRKTVSIVFVDLVGSTALGERLDPEVLAGVLGRYFEAVRSCLLAHGGTVEKYIGDAVVGVFGIPEVREDDALRAVRAAVEARTAVHRLAGEVERDHRERLDARIGVATGEVLAGSASAGTLVSGDAGNLAARLEQAAGPGEILVAASTYELVRSVVDAEPVEPLLLKGKVLPVAAHRLHAVGDAEAMVRVADTPLVGRRRQLAGATLAYEVAVEDRACSLLTILGEPGVGKSRLAAEVVRRVEADARVLVGRCLPYGRGITYWPLAEMVREACGADRDQSGGADVAAALRAMLDGIDEAQAVAGNLAAIAGADTTASREALPWAVRKLFEHLAAERPLVAFFEDIHWAEPALLDLIENVVEWSRDVALLVLCTARPEMLERRPLWGGGKRRATTIHLESLSPGDAAELIRHRVSGDVDAATEQSITAAAEGNPLFIEQLVTMLVENGRLSRDGGGWSVSAPEQVRMPPSIQALLAARLDSLDVAEREVVDVASVVGKEFGIDAVVTLTGAPDERVTDALQSLVRRDVIRPDGGSFSTFRFRHILIRDAAYEMLAKEHRARLHERLADCLVDTAGPTVTEIEEIVGYHLEQACGYLRELRPSDSHAGGLAARAAAHLHAGGRRALGRGDMAAAAELLARARELTVAGVADRGAIELALADARAQMGALDEARSILEQTALAAQEAGDRRLELHARLHAAGVALSAEPEGAAERCRAIAEEAIPVFTAAGDHHGLAIAWSRWGEPEHMRCKWAAFASALERSLSEARLAGDAPYAGQVMGILAHAVTLGPLPVPEAINRCRQLLEAAAGVPHLVARIRTRIGVLLAMAGRDEDALHEITEAESMFRELGIDYLFGSFGLTGSTAYRWTGRLDEAERLLRSADTLFERAGERSLRSTTLANLARVLVDQGRVEEADRTALLALDTGSTDDLATVAEALGARAQALAVRGRFEEAEAMARTAIDRAGEGDMPWLIGDAWESYGRVLLAAGRREEADQVLRRAVDAHARKQADGLAARIEQLRSAIGGA